MQADYLNLASKFAAKNNWRLVLVEGDLSLCDTGRELVSLRVGEHSGGFYSGDYYTGLTNKQAVDMFFKRAKQTGGN